MCLYCIKQDEGFDLFYFIYLLLCKFTFEFNHTKITLKDMIQIVFTTALKVIALVCGCEEKYINFIQGNIFTIQVRSDLLHIFAISYKY